MSVAQRDAAEEATAAPTPIFRQSVSRKASSSDLINESRPEAIRCRGMIHSVQGLLVAGSRFCDRGRIHNGYATPTQAPNLAMPGPIAKPEGCGSTEKQGCHCAQTIDLGISKTTAKPPFSAMEATTRPLCRSTACLVIARPSP